MTDPNTTQPLPPYQPTQPPYQPTQPTYQQLQPTYAAPVYLASVAPPSNALAVVSMIFGILTWVFLPVLGAIVAVICGHVALRQLRRTGEGGRGMAIAGLILGWIELGFVALGVVLWVVFGLFVFGAMAGAAGGAS